jgi:chromosome segregation ATPase
MKEEVDITIDLIRASTESIARERRVTVLEVTNKNVKDFLKRGNDGYIGAHLQTVKIEYIRSKLFDEKLVSHQLNAAIYDLNKLCSDNAREVALAEAEITQQMFDEICERNTELEEAVNSKEQQLTEQMHIHTGQIHKLESTLHTTQMEKNTIEVRHTDTLQAKDKAEQMLGDAQVERGAMKSTLVQFESQRVEQEATTKELKEKLEQLEQECDMARDSNQKAQQRADLLTWKNEQFIEENTELKRKLELAIERTANAEAQTKVLKETKPKPLEQTSRTKAPKASDTKKSEK